MSEILKGMTREQARQSLCSYDNGAFVLAMVINGKIYIAPDEVFPDCKEYGNGADAWHRAINAHFDDLEKPKWVEPIPNCWSPAAECDDCKTVYYCQSTREVHGQVKKDNARRKIEAFIAANGGNGVWEFQVQEDGSIELNGFELVTIGRISCATRELAEAVIERFPAELRLLSGVEWRDQFDEHAETHTLHGIQLAGLEDNE
jgi:hypothetical protein